MNLKQQGITLTELLISLTIIIILSTVAIPSFLTLLKHHRTKNTAEELFNFLNYARSEAIKRNTPVYISFSSGNNWCYGINISTPCDCNIPSSCNLGSQRASNANQTSLSLIGYPNNHFYFEGSRGAASESGTIMLNVYGSNSAVNIKIGLLGNISQCANGLSGYAPC
jgi:type IV fimbrial biogenesis protein FimT